MDFNKTIDQIYQAFKTEYTPQYNEVKEIAEKAFDAARQRAAQYTMVELSGEETDPDFFAEQMKQELKIMENELLSYKIIAANLPRQAVNTAINVIAKLVYNVIAPAPTATVE